MLKVTKKIEYALIALKFMAQKMPGELTSAREVCDHFKTPFDTTAKVMQVMNTEKILTSVKGVKGGYTLSIALNELNYFKLHTLIEDMHENVCHNNKGLCDLHSACNIIAPMQQLNELLKEFLSTLSIQELLFGAESPSQVITTALKAKM